jgi:hypothetical protein
LLLPLFVLGPLFTHTPASPPSRFRGVVEYLAVRRGVKT